jgi:hypothetical protein
MVRVYRFVTVSQARASGREPDAHAAASDRSIQKELSEDVTSLTLRVATSHQSGAVQLRRLGNRNQSLQGLTHLTQNTVNGPLRTPYTRTDFAHRISLKSLG